MILNKTVLCEPGIGKNLDRIRNRNNKNNQLDFIKIPFVVVVSQKILLKNKKASCGVCGVGENAHTTCV